MKQPLVLFFVITDNVINERELVIPVFENWLLQYYPWNNAIPYLIENWNSQNDKWYSIYFWLKNSINTAKGVYIAQFSRKLFSKALTLVHQNRSGFTKWTLTKVALIKSLYWFEYFAWHSKLKNKTVDFDLLRVITRNKYCLCSNNS